MTNGWAKYTGSNRNIKPALYIKGDYASIIQAAFFESSTSQTIVSSASPASFVLTGADADDVLAFNSAAGATAYSITAFDANSYKTSGAQNIVSSANPASFIITGFSATDTAAFLSSANTTAYVATGNAATGVVAKLSNAGYSSFTLSFFDATSTSTGAVSVVSSADPFLMRFGFADSYGPSNKKSGTSSKHKKAIMRDDEDLLLCISQYMCIASNN